MGKPSRDAKGGHVGARRATARGNQNAAGAGRSSAGRGGARGTGPDRSPGTRGSGSSRSHARAYRPDQGLSRPRISWSRRLGAVLALTILGTSIVLAGQALDGGRPDRGRGGGGTTPAAGGTGPSSTSGNSLALPPVPNLKAPALTLVAAATTDIEVTLPEGVPRDGSYGLRVYVNDRVVRERRMPGRDQFVLRSVPLEQGENRISAAIHGPAGEGLHSTVLLVVRDDIAPRIRLTEPGPDQTVRADTVTLRGATEAGAALSLTNETSGEELSLAVGPDGEFEAEVDLDPGINRLALTAVDAAGNRGRAEYRVFSADSGAQVGLTISDDSLSLAALPATVTLSAVISDERGTPVDDADVTFSISQPGQSTVTYRATSDNGLAVWRNVRLPREGALAGQGFATVMVVLPTGATLQGSAVFTIR